MRIVAGAFAGRDLASPNDFRVRPTAEHVRAALLDLLREDVKDARVLDLFAGTGALGLEALSRGAAHALFVDVGGEARALIRENVEALAAGGVTRIFRRDATKLGPTQDDPFTLAFLDPPYGKGLAPRALASLREGRWLAPGALVVVEEEAEAEIGEAHGFARLERRDYGDTQIVIFRAE